jgi:hypothetical protein
VQISRRTKARSKGSVPAPRVKQRIKIKMSRSQFRIPQEMQAGRIRNQQSEDREVMCVVLCERCRNACLPEMRSLISMIHKEIQNKCSLACKDK